MGRRRWGTESVGSVRHTRTIDLLDKGQCERELSRIVHPSVGRLEEAEQVRCLLETAQLAVDVFQSRVVRDATTLVVHVDR